MNISIVIVLGNIKDEWCVFQLCFFLKSTLKKNLTNHLDLVVRIFAQDHYSMNIFPFEDAIKQW
jgi:hypothetical protein